MTAAELEAKVFQAVRNEYPNAKSAYKMDITMRDAVMYAAGASIKDYALFSTTTGSNKTSGLFWPHFCSPLAINWSMMTWAPFAKSPN